MELEDARAVLTKAPHCRQPDYEPNTFALRPSLPPETSGQFQQVAASIVQSLGVARVHLDVRYWRKDILYTLYWLPESNFHE